MSTEKVANGFSINNEVIRLNYETLENKPDIAGMVDEIAPPIINAKMDPVIQETNEYIHDQRCIQFQENDNIAMVILDEMAKHKWPYSAKFMSKDTNISSSLKQAPPLDEFTTDLINASPSTGGIKGGLGGLIINAYCVGGGTTGGTEEKPDYSKYCYLELSTVARNAKDVNRFKWWCRLANNTSTRPSETSQYTQLQWQKALDDGNFGFATMKRFETANENIVQRIFTDFSNQYKPYHAFYTSLSDSITSTLKKIPTELVGSFQLHVWTGEGDAGNVNDKKWKGVYHFDLIGHNAEDKPVKFIGYLNYTGTSKPGTTINITWEKVSTETVTDIRN